MRVWYHYSLKYNVPGNHIQLSGKVSKEVPHTAALLIAGIRKRNFYVPSRNRTIAAPYTLPTAYVFLLSSCACMSSAQQLTSSTLSDSVNPVKIIADPSLTCSYRHKNSITVAYWLRVSIANRIPFYVSVFCKVSVFIRIALKCFCLT